MTSYTEWRIHELEKQMRPMLMYFIIVTIIAIIAIALLLFANTGECSSEVDVKKAVIHHTASHDVSAREIDRWHKERGWDGIGYHFVIRANGSIENGRSLNKKGAHAKGRNEWVGIVLTGYDSFTVAQTESLTRLLRILGVMEVERHHEKCPGRGLQLSGLSWN